MIEDDLRRGAHETSGEEENPHPPRHKKISRPPDFLPHEQGPKHYALRLESCCLLQRPSTRRSLSSGGSPSRTARLQGGISSNEAANALCAATANMVLHLLCQAAWADLRSSSGVSLALARARRRTKINASVLQPPLTSQARITKLHLDPFKSSG
jgi:hypothetical protein